MDVFKFHIYRAAGKLHVGEVPESTDAQFDKTVGCILGHGLRDRQDDHVHSVLPDETVQIVHRVDGDAVDGGADHRRGDVEGGIHGEAGVGEGEVLQQGVAQIAYADHDQMVVVVHTQNVADFRPQFLHVVSIALLAEFAEAAEVLPDLGGGDIHLLSQGMGGDADYAAVAKIGELPVISGKTPDHGIGNVFFFQSAQLLFWRIVKIFANVV